MRVLMVCTGNICRSVMAHAVLEQQALRRDVRGLVVDSAGVSNEEEGNPPDRRARRVLVEAGYRVPDHAARQVEAGDFEAFDVMLAMTSSHRRALERLVARYGVAEPPEIRLYREWDPSGCGDVPDPWYGGYDDFVDTLACIERVTPRLLERYATNV